MPHVYISQILVVLNSMVTRGMLPHSESSFGNMTKVRKELDGARKLVASCKKAMPETDKAEFSYRIFDPRKDLNGQLQNEDIGREGRRVSPRRDGPNGTTAGPHGHRAWRRPGRGTTAAARTRK